MKYAHLTQPERYQIAILNKAVHDQSEIARVMNRHPSTISREEYAQPSGWLGVDRANHRRVPEIRPAARTAQGAGSSGGGLRLNHALLLIFACLAVGGAAG